MASRLAAHGHGRETMARIARHVVVGGSCRRCAGGATLGREIRRRLPREWYDRLLGLPVALCDVGAKWPLYYAQRQLDFEYRLWRGCHAHHPDGKQMGESSACRNALPPAASIMHVARQTS